MFSRLINWVHILIYTIGQLPVITQIGWLTYNKYYDEVSIGMTILFLLYIAMHNSPSTILLLTMWVLIVNLTEPSLIKPDDQINKLNSLPKFLAILW